MKLEEVKKIKIAYTHSMKFHSDDVFSAAFLQIINPDIEIIRVNKLPDNFKGLAFDIGLGEFDHHQANNEKRENGIPYAAFGKLWRAFAKDLYGEYVYKRIDKLIIEDLDMTDNIGTKHSLAIAIDAFNPLNGSCGDKEFFKTVKFAKKVLEQLIAKAQKYEAEALEVKKCYEKSEDKRLIILDKHLYYQDVLPFTEAIYVIYPNNRGGYAAQGVTINPDTVELKKPFPKEWVNNLPDYLRFCHNSRFLIASDTFEGVLKACKEALK